MRVVMLIRRYAKLALVAAVGGCASMQAAPLPRATVLEGTEAQVRVGVAEIDITPPVGLGLFGHGPEGRVATGTALRLRCQAIVILGAGTVADPGEALALLPCDLAAPSLLLQRSVAARVADRRIPLGAERIVLMATHTHHAPGHYFGVNNYLGPFSSRRTGHDPRLLAMLAKRMAHAIEHAYRNAKPARMGWAQAPMQQPLTRNRNPHPLLHDEHPPAWFRARVEHAGQRPEEGAVDPTLSVLRIDQLDGSRYVPAGVFAVLGMHPTANPSAATLYSGDVFGYATRFVQDAVHARSPEAPSFVAALANGIEGDVMPARQVAGLREARRFGRRVADEVFALWKALGDDPTRLRSDVRVEVAYRELRFAGADTQAGAELCTRPELGTAAGGGANDHPTLLRLFPQYNPGATSTRAIPCGAPKLPVLMIDGEAEAGREFPGVAPVSVIALGDHVLVTLPAEVTTMAGVRIREDLADALNLPLPGMDPTDVTGNVGRRVVVIGLANEYLQYVATPEEYALQYYEGASTLYGPNTARMLRDHVLCLGRSLVGGDADACRLEQAKLNQLTRWSHPALGDAELLQEEPGAAAAPAAVGAPDTSVTRDGLLAMRVTFAGPEPDSVREREQLWVEVRREADATLVDDDRGVSVLTEWLPYTHAGTGWTATWIPDVERVRSECGKRFFFVIGNAAGRVTSRAFPLDCAKLTDLSAVWP